jgi:serine/threonine protein phosphatase PrpC
MNDTLSISAFTLTGAVRTENQDRVLAQNLILDKGTCSFVGAQTCFCFVADGVGGRPAGGFAAQFALELIREKIRGISTCDKDSMLRALGGVNEEMLSATGNDPARKGCATTLAGVIIDEKGFRIVNIGDSPVFAYRNGMLIRLSVEHSAGTDEGAPITSYLGCVPQELTVNLDTVVQELLPQDIILVASDGLFGALEMKDIKSVLGLPANLRQRAEELSRRVEIAAPQDNVSAVLVELTQYDRGICA